MSMNDIAIRVENLGKRYRIGQQESYQVLSGCADECLLSLLSADCLPVFAWPSMNGNGQRLTTGGMDLGLAKTFLSTLGVAK